MYMGIRGKVERVNKVDRVKGVNEVNKVNKVYMVCTVLGSKALKGKRKIRLVEIAFDIDKSGLQNF